jgi:AcrR family transcriptional regulator
MARRPKDAAAGINADAAASGAGSTAGGGMTKSPRDRIIDALMALAAERAWDEIDLPSIAERAGVTLGEFRDAFPSKGAILAGFSRRIDRIVLDGTGPELADEGPKERLFDVLMRRLDAMAPYKEGLRGVMNGVRADPLSLAALNQLALNSHRFMLAAAGIDTEGPLGALKLQGVVLSWSRVLDTWFRDEDPGLARTMAKLDQELMRGGRLVARLNDLGRMTSPFRAFFESAAEGGRRLRERQRAERTAPPDDDEEGYAPA